MQRPHAENIIDLELFLLYLKTVYEDYRRYSTGQKCRQRVHDVTAGTNCDESREGAVVNKTRVIFAGNQSKQDSANHCHQGVDGYKSGNTLQIPGAHDIETEPANRKDPGPEGQKRNIADGDRI